MKWLPDRLGVTGAEAVRDPVPALLPVLLAPPAWDGVRDRVPEVIPVTARDGDTVALVACVGVSVAVPLKWDGETPPLLATAWLALADTPAREPDGDREPDGAT